MMETRELLLVSYGWIWSEQPYTIIEYIECRLNLEPTSMGEAR